MARKKSDHNEDRSAEHKREPRSLSKVMLDEETRIYDVTLAFSQGKREARIAKEQAVRRHSVVQDVQKAFLRGMVRVPMDHLGDLHEQLSQRFDGVTFSVIASRRYFGTLAAAQVLDWTRELCDVPVRIKRPSRFDEWIATDPGQLENWPIPADTPFVAVGGGSAMTGLADRVASVLDPAIDGTMGPMPGGKEAASELRNWFATPRVCFINATAGGRVLEPKAESSHVTFRIGESTRQRYAVYSSSPLLSKLEEVAIRHAIHNTRVIVSGIGDTVTAYCIQVFRERGVLKSSVDEIGIAGEILYHLFDKQANRPKLSDHPARISVQTRERQVETGGQPQGDAVLSTLFAFEGLRGRPAENKHVEMVGGSHPPAIWSGWQLVPQTLTIQ